MQAPSNPPLKTRLLAWLILGGLAACLCEIPLGFTLLPLTSLVGLLLIVPLYVLHLSVLGSLIVRPGVPRWPSLVLAGALFGLFETYVTKLAWDPPYPQKFLIAGDLRLLELFWFGFFWHTVFGFILPLVLAEGWLSGQQTLLAQLPPRWRRLLATPGRHPIRTTLLLLALGLVSASWVPADLTLLLACVGNAAVILLLLRWWRRHVGSRRYGLAELLPSGRQFTVLVVLLALAYGVYGAFARPAVLPPLSAQAVVWVLYAALAWLLWRSLQKPAAVAAQGPQQGELFPELAPVSALPRPRLRAMLLLLLGLGAGVGGGALLGFGGHVVVAALSALAGGVLMLVWLFGATLTVLRSRRRPDRQRRLNSTELPAAG